MQAFISRKGWDEIIAIDPDVEKSGVAMLNPTTKFLHAETMPFPKLIDWLLRLKSQDPFAKRVVLVEASWNIQSNWHLQRWNNNHIAARKGYDVGRNHETGRKIVECAKAFGFEVVEQIPLRKCWKGKDGKITQEEIEYFIPNMPKKANQDVRDAVLIAWNFANLPIRVNVQKK